MKPRCYLAVDGGNTKTEYRLLDANGAVIASHRGKASNHETLPGSYAEAAQILCDGARAMLAEHGLMPDAVADAVFGLAGADCAPQVKALSAALGELGFNRFLVCNDGYLGVLAGTENGVGVCYSAGTGVTCAAIAPNGRRAQVGGLGALSGDIGGGYDIVVFVYRTLYAQLFLGRAATPLQKAYFTLLDIHTREEFLSSAARLSEERIAHALIALFFASLETDDSDALSYAADCAVCAADRILAAADELRLATPIACVFSGSILVAAAPPLYRHMIEYELLRRRGDAFVPCVSERPPVDGAARWVRLRNGLPRDV